MQTIQMAATNKSPVENSATCHPTESSTTICAATNKLVTPVEDLAKNK